MSRQGPSCRYLFHQRYAGRAGDQGAVRVHAHPFWQLEVVAAGDVRVHLGEEELRLGPGGAILLPPAVEHGFGYHGASNDFVSVKFEAEGVPTRRHALVLPADPVLRVLVEAIAALCRSEDAGDAGWRTVLEGQVSLLLVRAWTPGEAPLEEDPAVAAVGDLVRQLGGRRISVAELAARAGLSPGRLGTRFRAANGCSLKAYVDRASAGAAARLLEFSDFGVAVIAEQLGFADQFSFSRFFRRMTGRSPTAWRAARRR